MFLGLPYIFLWAGQSVCLLGSREEWATILPAEWEKVNKQRYDRIGKSNEFQIQQLFELIKKTRPTNIFL